MRAERWEYLQTNQESEVKRLGVEGWELVSVTSHDGGQVFHLKRPAQSLRERTTIEQSSRLVAAIDRGEWPPKDPPHIESELRILNPDVLHLIASTGHTDWITICDRGFPVPIGPTRIDLSLTDDIPTVVDVVKALKGSFEFDRVIFAQEILKAAPERIEELRRLLPGTAFEQCPHVELKHMAQDSRGVIRTGDSTPWSNIILVCG